MPQALGFDGKVLWERAFSGKPQVLDFGESETYRAFMAVRTYRWLAENSPYSIKAGQAAEKDAEIRLTMAGPNDVIPTELVLDRRSWLPVRASRRGLFGAVVWKFDDYGEFHGMKWPRKSTLHHGKAVEEFRVTKLEFIPQTASAMFGLPQVKSQVSWDATLRPRVELMRTPSGHFFVKAKLNGHELGWFALDTGTGSGMTISRRAADQLHLTAFGKTFMGGASQQVQTQMRETESFQVGPATMRPAVLYELPPSFTDAMSALFGFEWAGTIGHSFLSQVVAELNLSTIALELRRPEEYKLKQGEWQPMRLNHGIPCLKVNVEGRHEDWFQLDTGAAPWRSSTRRPWRNSSS